MRISLAVHALWSALLLVGCTLLYPPRYERVSLLVPRSDPGPGYTLGEDETIAYAVKGCGSRSAT